MADIEALTEENEDLKQILNQAVTEANALTEQGHPMGVMLRILAGQYPPYEEPAPEEQFWDDRTTPGAYGKSDSDRDMKAIEVLAAFLTKAGLNEKRARTLAHGAVMSKALRVEAI